MALYKTFSQLIIYMSLKKIIEIENKNYKKGKILKEKMDIFIPDVKPYFSCRNGMVYVLVGSGGSGKTQLLMSLFKNKDAYFKNFHHIYYFCPASSYLSLEDHPFKKHPNTFHELTVDKLSEIYDELNEIKETSKKTQYSAIVIDDFAADLKNKDIVIQLNKMIIKARHIACSFIFTLQSYLYFPKILRKQLTYISIFKPKNYYEFESLATELLNMKKDDALKLFNYVFDEPYQHLDVCTVTNKYYKSFNPLELEY